MGISAALGSNALLPAGLGFRNIVINGGMDIWQRGTSGTIPSTIATAFQADRWSAYRAVSGSTQSRVPASLSGFQFALRVQRDSGNTSTSPIYFNQSFETTALSKVAGLPTVISFYARAGANYSASGSSLLVRFGVGTGTEANVNYGSFTSYTEPLIETVSLTTNWQRFIMYVTVPANTTQAGLYFTISPTGTAGAADFIDITGVQFEQNTQPTSFEQRPFGIELALCQRYYFTQINDGTTYIDLSARYGSDIYRIAVFYTPVSMRKKIASGDITLTISSGSPFYDTFTNRSFRVGVNAGNTTSEIWSTGWSVNQEL